MKNTLSHRMAKVGVSLLVGLGLAGIAQAGSREQAVRMHKRLTGTNPSAAVLQKMAELIEANKPNEAAMVAIDNPGSAENPDGYNYFYSATLNRFFKPWFDKDDALVPLNDGIATLIGMTRDDVPFNQMFSQNIIYLGAGFPTNVNVRAFDLANNNHYLDLENQRLDLRKYLVRKKQTSPDVDPEQRMLGYDTVPAGLLTTRGWASVYYFAGTNRAPIRFMLKRAFCEDIEAFHDTTREDTFVRRDVDRNPGGDPGMFVNKCKGCHAGMDPMSRAFAYLDWDDTAKKMVFTEPLPNTPVDKLQCPTNAEVGKSPDMTFEQKKQCAVVKKFLNNKETFPSGFTVKNDEWENRWTDGQNARVGWPGKKGEVISGRGPKELGQMFTRSRRFSQCMAEQVYKFVCLRPNVIGAADKDNVVSLAQTFEANGYKMKTLFADTAVLCRGE